METDVRLRSGQPDRLRVGDEVDLVSALRELEPQLGRDYAAAAIRRITSDSYLHEGLRLDESLRPAIHNVKNVNVQTSKLVEGNQLHLLPLQDLSRRL